MRKISNGSCQILFSLLIAATVLLLGRGANAAEQPSSSGEAELLSRMNRLEARVEGLEAEVTKLKSENQGMREALDRAGESGAGAASHTAVAVASPPDKPSRARDRAESDSRWPATEWGARMVYQGFPFKQREGGLGYGFFFAHRLLSEGEDLPAGDLDTEVAIGIARSGVDHVNVFSQVTLEHQNVGLRQNMLWIWPSLKYDINRWSEYGIRPYIIGGAGFWADTIESPPLFVGEAPGAQELASRKFTVDASASIYEGGQGGAGIELSLARTRIPIIDRLGLGFDYRYSAWVTGQRYSAYSLSLFTAN